MRSLALIPLVLVAVPFAVPLWAGGETTAPVPIYTPPLRTPPDAGGTGQAPEVSVEVDIDPRGRLVDARVLSVRPASEFDELFATATRETLLRWRYAPATVDGAPVATTLRWMVQFPKIDARDDDELDRPPIWLDERRGTGGGSHWAELMTLPLDKRAAMLAEKAEVAASCMNDKAMRRVNSPRFIVFTDAPGEETAKTLAGNLEATFDTLVQFLGEGLPLQPEPYRVAVFVYADRTEFDRLKRRIEAFEWSEGFYNPLGMLAFHLQMPSNEALLGVLLHEATHAWVDRYLARPGVVFPRWLGEGFAEYVGNSEISKGKLVPGKTRRTEIYRTPFEIVRGTSLARLTIDDLKTKIKDGSAPSLDRVLTADPDEFYGEERSLFYSVAWLLVHFLRHGEDSWADERFPELLLYVAEGYPSDEVVRRIYGDLDALEARFDEYVRRF